VDSQLTQEVKDFTYKLGGDICGIADLSPYQEQIEKEFGDVYKSFDKAVSVGVYFPSNVINQLMDGPTHTYLHYYRVVNVLIDDIALKLSTFLLKKGYESFPIPSSQRISKDKLQGIFSHRMAASLAGLGWIGKNSNLVNPEVGPRLRIITVLTDAPLVSDQPMESQCGECLACMEACPAEAIKGIHFEPSQSIEDRLDANKCDQYQNTVRSSFGKRVCGKCLAVCPWGKSKKSKKTD